MKWEGLYVVDLYKDGEFYASRSMNCGPSTFDAACDQWRRKGYTIKVKEAPNSKKGT